MSYQVEISALSDVALINLRGAKEALGCFESALEMEFPKSAQAVYSREGITVLSLGPDHWWVRTSIQNEEQTFNTLAKAIATEHAAVTVVSDHFSGFSIVGPEAPLVLRQGLSLDLRSLTSGQCTRGSFARCGGTLHIIDELYHYDLFVESSYADYVETWFSTASGNVRVCDR
jgi:sarcosine oxidase subunit gamma